jgi:hypothetical protein
MSVFMPASLDVRNHLETYGTQNLNVRTLLILHEKLSKDLRAGYALMLELGLTQHSEQSALKLELAKAMSALAQIDRQLNYLSYPERTKASLAQDKLASQHNVLTEGR